ncbi:hypothetical protein [Streptomyces solicathayae]|uniref:Integral membrane protein n=1 Tax=Streptomyces solicathayae TaxID=3081768 RepID=A0ABZ0M3U7_9ACTN|nr:hypothetical protein [Streptomyces sp. HUAS YS2]WOX26374.1 hypothetical protein R2D22_35385 [Streptomyces sp. HUAS YS2]
MASSSSRTPLLPRLLKALVVSLVAVAASHVVLSDTLRLSLMGQAAAALGEAPGYSSDQAFTAAVVNTLLTMPLVLWPGMLISGERRVGPMVLVGTVSWQVAVWSGIDALGEAPGVLLPLPSLALVVAVTALAAVLRRK